jgi:hypothetical protein
MTVKALLLSLDVLCRMVLTTLVDCILLALLNPTSSGLKTVAVEIGE